MHRTVFGLNFHGWEDFTVWQFSGAIVIYVTYHYYGVMVRSHSGRFLPQADSSVLPSRSAPAITSEGLISVQSWAGSTSNHYYSWYEKKLYICVNHYYIVDNHNDYYSLYDSDNLCCWPSQWLAAWHPTEDLHQGVASLPSQVQLRSRWCRLVRGEGLPRQPCVKMRQMSQRSELVAMVHRQWLLVNIYSLNMVMYQPCCVCQFRQSGVRIEFCWIARRLRLLRTHPPAAGMVILNDELGQPRDIDGGESFTAGSQKRNRGIDWSWVFVIENHLFSADEFFVLFYPDFDVCPPIGRKIHRDSALSHTHTRTRHQWLSTRSTWGHFVIGYPKPQGIFMDKRYQERHFHRLQPLQGSSVQTVCSTSLPASTWLCSNREVQPAGCGRCLIHMAPRMTMSDHL